MRGYNGIVFSFSSRFGPAPCYFRDPSTPSRASSRFRSGSHSRRGALPQPCCCMKRLLTQSTIKWHTLVNTTCVIAIQPQANWLIRHQPIPPSSNSRPLFCHIHPYLHRKNWKSVLWGWYNKKSLSLHSNFWMVGRPILNKTTSAYRWAEYKKRFATWLKTKY